MGIGSAIIIGNGAACVMYSEAGCAGVGRESSSALYKDSPCMSRSSLHDHGQRKSAGWHGSRGGLA